MALRENKIFGDHRYYRTTTMIHTYDVVAHFTPETGEPFSLDWTGKERYRAAQILRTARKVSGTRVDVTHHVEFRVVWTTLCAGCLARESEWEYDCDGQYDTVNCGECDWFAAFHGRHTLENSPHCRCQKGK